MHNTRMFYIIAYKYNSFFLNDLFQYKDHISLSYIFLFRSFEILYSSSAKNIKAFWENMSSILFLRDN